MLSKGISLSDYSSAIGVPKTEVFVGNFINPINNNAFDKYFLYPNPIVTRLPKLRIFGGSFVAMTPDGQVIEDMSLLDWSKRVVTSSLPASTLTSTRIRRIDRRTMILGGQRNYYHWLLNWLSRVFIIEKAGMIDEFDSVLVNDNLATYQREILELVPALSRKKIVSISNRECVEFDQTLCAPIFSNPIHSPLHIDWLRAIIGSVTSPVKAQRIYISRRDAPQARRQIVNEAALATLLRKEGYVEVVLSDYSVRQQAAIFAQAREIIAPHGAGLANCIFLQPDARICEIQAESHYTRVFWSLGVLAKTHRYDLIRCKSVAKGPAYLQDLFVDLQEVHKILDNWKMKTEK